MFFSISKKPSVPCILDEKRKSKIDTSVIFIHGINSDGTDAWTHKNGTFWPTLVLEEATLQDIGVYVYTYHTNIYSGTYSISDAVGMLREWLNRLELVISEGGEKKDHEGPLINRLIFVCHSMGGIVARKYIIDRQQDLKDKHIGLFLVASPSLGSSYANLVTALASNIGLRNTQAEALRFINNNPWLNDLDENFLNLKEENIISIKGKELIEDEPIALPSGWWRQRVVEPFSGARYFGRRIKVAKSNHLTIAKPENKESEQHWLLCGFIAEIIGWIDVSQAQYDSMLRKILTLLSQEKPENEEKILLLKDQRKEIQKKLNNPESTLKDYKETLSQTYKVIDEINKDVNPKQVKQAQDALRKGETADAEKLLTQVLTSGMKTTAEAAFQLAQLSYNRIEYQTAFCYYLKAVDLKPDNPLYLHKAGLTAYRMGRYKEAEPLYKRSLKIREKTLGPEDLDVAQSLNNLATLYYSQGQYGKAEPMYKRSLNIREKALDPEHCDVAQSLNNLAALYHSQHQYGKAEPLYQQSLVIREKTLGFEHPDVAESLNNLAELYREQNQYGKAEPLYKRSLEIWEKALGLEHPDVADSLNNYAMLYCAQDLYGQAEPLYQRSLNIREKALGSEHPDVAESLNNLAELYRKQAQYGKAEPLYQRAIAILEKALGSGHHDVEAALNNLASLYREQGQGAKAKVIEARIQAFSVH